MLTLSDEILPATNINQLTASGMPGEFQFHANRLSDIFESNGRFDTGSSLAAQISAECCGWHVHDAIRIAGGGYVAEYFRCTLSVKDGIKEGSRGGGKKSP
jgi:hypothetical protein